MALSLNTPPGTKIRVVQESRLLVVGEILTLDHWSDYRGVRAWVHTVEKPQDGWMPQCFEKVEDDDGPV